MKNTRRIILSLFFLYTVWTCLIYNTDKDLYNKLSWVQDSLFNVGAFLVALSLCSDKPIRRLLYICIGFVVTCSAANYFGVNYVSEWFGLGFPLFTGLIYLYGFFTTNTGRE